MNWSSGTIPMRRLPGLLVLLAGALVAAPARACDICAVYTATTLQESRTGFRLGVAEQFSRFSTLQENGHRVDNPDNEYVNSSITQLLFGYALHPRFGVQANLPLIRRDYRRLEDTGMRSGNASGIGDLSLLAQGLLFRHASERRVLLLSGLFGIKLPTGSPGRLAEELTENEVVSEPEIPPVFRSNRWRPRHGDGDGHESGVHGHDLALGTGSADVLLGGNLLGTWDRFFLSSSLHYYVRTEGAYGYRYANELILRAAPGVYAWLTHRHSLGLQGVVTCDTKGTDSLNGERMADTGLTSLYAGPGLTFTWGTNLSADLVADLPVFHHNSDLQIVTNYRIRGGLLWRF